MLNKFTDNSFFSSDFPASSQCNVDSKSPEKKIASAENVKRREELKQKYGFPIKSVESFNVLNSLLNTYPQNGENNSIIEDVVCIHS